MQLNHKKCSHTSPAATGGMIEYLYKFLALYNSSMNKYETFAFGLTYDEYAHNDIIHACMSITLMKKCLHSVFTACKRGGGALY